MIYNPNYYLIDDFIDILWRLNIVHCKYTYHNEDQELIWIDDNIFYLKILEYYERMAIQQRKKKSIFSRFVKNVQGIMARIS